MNISAYSSPIGSTYIQLPNGLKTPMKGLIKNKKTMTVNAFFGVILDI